ncbi:predicted protein [Scheffersomyces stipitis CBS 6054]|uniref:Kinesin-like protein n=1 Tax=Scheffersomyces stipitis (strain ATCC 58785 / CBS 6054 / NBRC 10063 / NRRL Y-11545) TaxID=322104 RepID=A3LU60_PICST|nr:predicted protein [Scheffersomyces stipitis CBS 6054]ABN66529.2 predicted protein [Scheffersomyces stipitis CBS 6054]
MDDSQDSKNGVGVKLTPSILQESSTSVLNTLKPVTSNERDKDIYPNKRPKYTTSTSRSSVNRLMYGSQINHDVYSFKERDLAEKFLLKSDLTSKISTIKTKLQEEDLQSYQLSQECISLKKQVASVRSQISELGDCEEMSLKSLKNKFEIQTRELRIKHEHKLNQLKEDMSNQAKKIIQDNNAGYLEEKDKLVMVNETLAKSAQQQMSEFRNKLIKLKEDHSKNLSNRTAQLEKKIESVKSKILELDTELETSLNVETAERQQALNGIEKETSRLKAILEQLQAKFKVKEAEIELLQNTLVSKRESIAALGKSYEDKTQQIEHYEQETALINVRLATHESDRRALHNTLQELKGNIRVFCRVRPALTQEKVSSLDIPDDEINDDSAQELILSRDGEASNSNSYSTYNSNKNSYKFQFDHIFSPTSTNEDIFEEISQLIQSSLDGYNVCVFAYGQTGSGKTFTMSNPGNGMIPMSLDKIFEDIDDLQAKGWKYEVEGQVVEIYNENIVDLLSPRDSTVKYDIKHDDDEGKTYITNITTVSISSKNQAESILDRATKNRSTASTRANDRSSRSHSIFTIRLNGENLKTGAKSQGTLNLVDLAGSERLSSSQATGDRLKETQAINKSLSCLGDVIYSLSQRQQSSQLVANQHVPYRNSKLTYLLKHSLGGNSKTLMFVNISPLLKNFNETLNSLRFATKVNRTKLSSSKPNSQ